MGDVATEIRPFLALDDKSQVGEFRLFAIPPGQYYLQATLRNGMMMTGSDSDDRSGYAATYYPGTPNVAEAQRITIGLGQTLNELNLALTTTRTSRITGSAADSAGKPLSGGTGLHYNPG